NAKHDDHQDGEAVHPEDRRRLAIELAQPRERQLPERIETRGRTVHEAVASSRRCRPVKATNTSSRLAWRGVRPASSRQRTRRRYRRAGSAMCGSVTESE